MTHKIKNFCNNSFFKIFAIFASLNIILRIIFSIWQYKEIGLPSFILSEAFVVGFLFDFITFCYIASFFLIYFYIIPAKIFNSKIHQIINKILYFIFLVVIIFSAFAEITFWQEFQTRFNFIAVDYLIYTTEVIENIIESYPIFWIVLAILAFSYAIFHFTHKNITTLKVVNQGKSPKTGLLYVFIAFLSFLLIDSSKLTIISPNHYVNEIAASGIYQFFSAYRNNKINYDDLYEALDYKKALEELRTNVSKQEPRSKFLHSDDIYRFIPKPRAGSEKKYNVIFVSMESFSADFMKYFGNQENITPNLDEIAKKSLFLTNLKATGTRTVRGLEALSLSIPPTPGNSIVRRMNNENLFNISTPFKERGYEAKFLYGGYGYFDNMNYFFGNNGFEIVDRAKFDKNEIDFENAWGVSDEDLYNKTIKEADKSFAQNKPFFNFVMTTSNHRPFTYPDGKIDIESKSGRNGAVKYSDYAIKKLLEAAKTKPWFDNTIFVFVADHCAGSAGNSDVPLWRYQIPAIFYAPKIIKPRIFNKNVSQIDIAPTLLGIMNFSYNSKFFGVDVITNEKTIDQHAFVSTYTDIGYFEGDMLYLLKPKKEHKFFNVKFEKFGWQGSQEIATDKFELEELDEVISYYQMASYFFENNKLKNEKDK